jgi:hypothetical protein
LEYNLNPSSEHLDSINRVIQFLYGTRYYAIEYGPTKELKQFIAASNVAFGNNEDRKSTKAFVIRLFGRPINWKASKQKTVSTLTTEAELLSISYVL